MAPVLTLDSSQINGGSRRFQIAYHAALPAPVPVLRPSLTFGVQLPLTICNHNVTQLSLSIKSLDWTLELEKREWIFQLSDLLLDC